MIALLLEIVLAIIFAVIAIICFGIFRAMPFFTGLIGAFVLSIQFPGLSNLGPIHKAPLLRRFLCFI